MSKVIIFGIQDFASLAHFYLKHDSDHEVVAFSVSEMYMPEEKEFEGVPIAPFENIEEEYLPEDYKFFSPMSPSKMNRLRENIYNQIKWSLIQQKESEAINKWLSSLNKKSDIKINSNYFPSISNK